MKWMQRVRTCLRRAQAPHPFAKAATQAFSQEGEDLLLKRIFQDQPRGFFVDVGAHHPIHFSNTLLLYRRGWRGVNIDAMPGSMAAFKQLRPEDCNIESGVAEEEGDMTYYCYEHPALNTFDPGEVEGFRMQGIESVETRRVHVRPLKDILHESIPDLRPLDLMTIDVEGLEMQVLRSNDWSKYRPKVLLVEKHVTTLVEALACEPTLFLRGEGYQCIAKTLNTLCFAEDAFVQELDAAL